MSRKFSSFAMIGLAILAGGCARYQYSIVEPAEFAQAIERRGNAVIDRDPLQYELVDLNRSLGVRIVNISDDPIRLLGEQSYIVTPDGANHGMTGGTIAPHSFTAFALPPRIRVYHPGPRVGFGFGVGSGVGHTHFGSGVGTTWGWYPGYHDTFSSYSPWDWGTGDVRMRASFEREGERFNHDFIFRRARVD